MTRGISQARQHVGLALVAMALVMRLLVPAGWMPSVENGRAGITICTGMGMAQAWVDSNGKIHKSQPNKNGQGERPCVFGGLGAALDVPALATLPLYAPPLTAITILLLPTVTVGHGLVAPPPPSTGPPLLN